MTLLELEKRFTYHPPKPGQPEIYAAIRAEAKKLAMLVFEHCPDSRELSLAITNIEEAVFWANAAIARNTDRPIYKGSADEGQEVAGAGEPGGVEACAGACEDGGVSVAGLLLAWIQPNLSRLKLQSQAPPKDSPNISSEPR